jgi:hypothetical protein
LEGIKINDTLKLAEIDPDENLSGFLHLINDPPNIIGYWDHVDRLLSSNIQLQLNTGQYIRKNCSGNKWIKKMNNTTSDSDLVLLRIADNRVYGYIEQQGDIPLEISGECVDSWCAEILISSESEFNGVLEFVGRDATFDLDNGKTIAYNFVDSWSLECTKSTDYYGSIDMVFPVINTSLTDKFIEQIAHWQNQWQFEIQRKFELGSYYPNDRWTHRYYGWLMIDFISDNFVSGVLELIDDQGARDAMVFNYDIENDELVEIDDLLKKDIDVISNAHGGNEKYLTFRKEGIHIRSQFDIIIGRKDLFVPYEGRKRLFKRKFFDLVGD